MGTVSARAFAAAVGDLDRAAFTGFVRDLLAARGDDVEVVGGGVLVATTGARERRVFVHRPSGFGRRSPTPPKEVDVIVTNQSNADQVRALAADHDAALVDARDLHGLLCYGLDRGQANEIARTHLGRPLSVPERSHERNRDDGTGAQFANRVADRWDRWEMSPREERVGRWGSVVAAGALIVALVAFGALGVGLRFDTVGVPSGDAGGGVDAASGSVESGSGAISVTPAPAATAGPRLESTNETIGILPPGLDGSGIADADALASTHERALENRSYRWTVTDTERVDGRTVARAREVVTFERPGVYRVDLAERGDPTIDPTLFTSQPAYADGERRYEPIRVAGSREAVRVTSLSVTEERAFRERAGTYIEWYLSVARSAITDVTERNGRTFYRIETIGDPYPGAENARASALIDERGTVHELRSERDIPESDTTVVLSFRYTAIGNATVEPPTWYEANDSAGTTTTTTATATGTERGTTTPESLRTTATGTDGADTDGTGTLATPGRGTESD